MTTKKIYNESISITKEQLQEFSILYLIINNFNFFKKNSKLLNDISFITTDGMNILSKLKELINSNDEINLNMLPVDNDMLEKINKFASVKHISKIFKEMKIKLKKFLMK